MKKKFSISFNLRELRNSNHLTVKDVHKATRIEENTLSKYETDGKIPSLPNLITIAEFYGVSLDFLIGWDRASFPRSVKLLTLAEQIDKLNQVQRFQIETTAKTLLGSQQNESVAVKLDEPVLHLISNFHKNLRTAREKKNLSQQQVADEMKIRQNRISAYEINNIPKAEMLISLSEYLGVSIHALATGRKLAYVFRNTDLLDVILRADKLLSLKDKQILITLMEKIIENKD